MWGGQVALGAGCERLGAIRQVSDCRGCMAGALQKVAQAQR